MVERFKRAEPVVVCWRHGRLCATNYLTRRTTPMTPPLLDLLDTLASWTSVEDIRKTFPRFEKSRDLPALLRLLARRGLLDRATRSRRTRALGQWTTWHPEAGLFHFGTQYDRYV